VASPVTPQWTPIATEHLRAAYEYIAQDNEAAADALIDRIFVAVEMLERYPQIGRAGRVKGTRELAIAGTPYVVAYRVRRLDTDILAVFHGARKWPERF
jgi:toxin ParE1/3/4